MLGVKLQRQNGGLGIKNNKRASLLGVKIYPMGKKNSLISAYAHNNDQKKSYLEK